MSLSMRDVLAFLSDNDLDPNDQIYAYLCSTDVNRLKSLLSRLDRVRNFKAQGKRAQGRKAALSGKVFEQVVRCLFSGCRALNCAANNVRSTTSEIDFLVAVQPIGNVIPFIKAAGTHLMGEAKLLSSGFKKEWIDELRGIMDTHGTQRGIIFTSVTSKRLGREPRMSIALHAAQGRLVIPFGLKHIAAVAAGENFLKLLSSQALAASNHLSEIEV